MTAPTLDDVKQTYTEAYLAGTQMVPQTWRPMFNWRTDQAAVLRVSAYTGIGEPPAWDGSSDITYTNAEDLGNTLLQGVDYALQVRVKRRDVKYVTDIVADLGRRLGIAFQSLYGTVAANVLNNAFGTTVSGDGLSLCNDSHTKRLGTRDNKMTSAFDRAAFFTALALARNWEDYEGVDYDLGDMGWYLTYPNTTAGNEETVAQVLGSAVTSSANQLNAAGSYNVTGIGWAKITDATYWFMVSKAESPLIFWEEDAPEDFTTIDEDNLGTKITVACSIKAGVKPTPDGIIGSDS